MTLRRFLALLGAILGFALYFAPPPEGVSEGVMQVAGVVAVTVALWATAVVPEYFTAILFFFFAVTLTGLTPKVVFSGFHSAAAWMIFGGLIIGVAVQSTGLGARMARVLLDRFGRSYLGLLFGTVTVAALAAFVLPTNTGRVLVLVPIFMSLADRLGFDEGSNGRTALALAVGAGTLYPGLAILPSAVPNLVLMSAAESTYGIAPTYGRYFLLHFPVIGLVSIIALPLILCALFPDIPRHRASIAKPGSMNLDERKLVLLLFAALALWASDFAHGISPAWIALGAGLLCLVPKIGVLPPSAIVNKINLAPWFFIAGVVSMSAAVSASGLGDLVGR